MLDKASRFFLVGLAHFSGRHPPHTSSDKTPAHNGRQSGPQWRRRNGLTASFLQDLSFSFYMHWVQAFPVVDGAQSVCDSWLTSASQCHSACKMQHNIITLRPFKPQYSLPYISLCPTSSLPSTTLFSSRDNVRIESTIAHCCATITDMIHN